MDNTQIRKYRQSDFDKVAEICEITNISPFMGRNMLLGAFCSYYVEREPQNCFVAVVGGQVVGYILCAEDSRLWSGVFKSEYIEKTKSLLLRLSGRSLIAAPLEFYNRYPAHLHINISPEYQRRGIGTKLMDDLTVHLSEKKVRGLMLTVAKSNTKGRRFYEKYGFAVIKSSRFEIVMGIKLS